MLIFNIADNFLHQILNCHQAVNAAIFVYHISHMDMGCAHFQQQILHRHGGRDEEDFPSEILPVGFGRLSPEIDQVLDMKHPDHIIEIVLINRQPGMVGLCKAGDDLFQSLAPLLALRKLDDISDEKLETTGLNDPQDALVLERKGKTIRLDVGGEVYGTRDRYVRDPESGDVYLVDDEVLRPLRYARTRLPDRTLWSFETKRIGSVTIGSPAGSIDILQKNAEDPERATWVRQDAPEEADPQLKTWMDKAFRLKSTSYASEDDDTDGIELLFSLTFTDDKGNSQTLEVLQKPGDDKADYWGRSEHTRGLVKLLRGQTRQLADDVGAVVGAEGPDDE